MRKLRAELEVGCLNDSIFSICKKNIGVAHNHLLTNIGLIRYLVNLFCYLICML